MSWLAPNRGLAAAWALGGGAVLVGATWYLKHVSPKLPAQEREADGETNDIAAVIEMLPWIGLLIGTYMLYMGAVRLVFGPSADAVDAKKTNAGMVMYWIGFVLALAAVALTAIFVLHLRLWALNADYYK